MKNIYEIPEVTIFEVGVCKQMIALSVFGTQKATSDDVAEGKGNEFDDDTTPWYRR